MIAQWREIIRPGHLHQNGQASMPPGYKQFCPVAMAAEVLCTRWTIVLLREFIAGSTRFNDLRRGVPRMSPALLSQRLKELEAAGIIERIDLPSAKGAHEYRLTEAGRDLQSVVETIGIWGQRWVDADLSLENLDPSLLMWDMRRNLNPTPTPKRRSVIQFLYTDLPVSQKYWWLIVEATGDVDLCSVDPGFDVDLCVTTKLRPMTSIWMGLSTVKSEQRDKNLDLDGDKALAGNMQTWLGLSPFAVERKRV
ncbi:MAG: DNA-binding HxlR family transcriptional regulator [Alphaproteobacteria bacterium]